MAKQPTIILQAEALDADAYMVRAADLTDVDRERLRKAWDEMNTGLHKRIPLIVVPESAEALDADAYMVKGNLSIEDRERLRKAWEEMNTGLSEKKILIAVPEHMNIEKLRTHVLHEWMDKLSAELKERGEE